MSRRISRRSAVFIALAAVLVLLLGCGVVIFSIVKTQALSAEGALQQYLSAISAGELTLANTLVPIPTGSPRPVAGTSLADPADRITAVRTSIISSTATTARGSVSFVLAGRRYSTTLKLASGAAQLGVLPNWQVTTPLTTTISVVVPVSGIATVNGVATSLGKDLKVTVYPGHYAVGLASNNPWYSSPTLGVDAGTTEVSARLAASPTPALRDAVMTQVKRAIDSCVATAVPVPRGCPFSEPAIGTLTGFRWVVNSYPTVAFLDPTHFFLEDGQVTADFVLSYSYIVNKKEEDPIAISGSGSVGFSGSSVTVTISAQ